VKVICDSAVLIGLAKIGKLDLLGKLYEKIYIPWAGYNEVVERGRGRPGSEEIDKAKWLRKKKVKDHTAVNLLASEFGQGESEVLVLGKEFKADWLILDDARARTAAISAGYRVIGLAGILLLAKQRNLIEEIKPLFEELVDKKFRLSDKIMKTILHEAGEQ
jgi:predicted nucleic acid-binding protein